MRRGESGLEVDGDGDVDEDVGPSSSMAPAPYPPAVSAAVELESFAQARAVPPISTHAGPAIAPTPAIKLAPFLSFRILQQL